MSRTVPEISPARVAAVIALAEEAGRAVMEIYAAGAGTVTTKGDGSPLTAADLAADTIIAAGLARLDPTTAVLSEETADDILPATRASWASFWCVDPLDGTKEFVSRTAEFTINIALVSAGQPLFGVVHAPALVGLPTWWGGPAVGGAWRRRGVETTAIAVAPLPPAGQSISVVASKSHRDAATDAWIAGLGRPVTVVAAGSSLKLCLIADGTAHAYPRFGPTNAWDTAAGHAVVIGAGGHVWSATGQPWHYAADQPLNPAFIAAVQRL